MVVIMEMAPLSLGRPATQRLNPQYIKPPAYLVVAPSSLQQPHHPLQHKPRPLVYSLNLRHSPPHPRYRLPLPPSRSQTYSSRDMALLLQLRVRIHLEQAL